MTEEATTNERLDTVMAMWHAWQGTARQGRGYNSKALVCGDYRVSRQYDDANGALDDDIDTAICRAVQVAVDQMDDPWRAAAYIIARSCCTGVMVWFSPRLPSGKDERDAVIAETRSRLIRRLRSDGVIE